MPIKVLASTLQELCVWHQIFIDDQSSLELRGFKKP